MIVTQIAPFTFFLRPIGSYSIPQNILMKLDIPAWPKFGSIQTFIHMYFITSLGKN